MIETKIEKVDFFDSSFRGFDLSNNLFSFVIQLWNGKTAVLIYNDVKYFNVLPGEEGCHPLEIKDEHVIESLLEEESFLFSVKDDNFFAIQDVNGFTFVKVVAKDFKLFVYDVNEYE